MTPSTAALVSDAQATWGEILLLSALRKVFQICSDMHCNELPFRPAKVAEIGSVACEQLPGQVASTFATCAQLLSRAPSSLLSSHSTCNHWPQAAPLRAEPVGAQSAFCLLAYRQRRSGGSTGNLQGMASMNMPGLSDALRSRLASLLATEFSKKVSGIGHSAGSCCQVRCAQCWQAPAEDDPASWRGSLPQMHCISDAELQLVGLGGMPNSRHFTCRASPSHRCRLPCRCT